MTLICGFTPSLCLKDSKILGKEIKEKQTLSDSHSSLTVELISKTVIIKELLKNGFSEGLNFKNVHNYNTV